MKAVVVHESDLSVELLTKVGLKGERVRDWLPHLDSLLAISLDCPKYLIPELAHSKVVIGEVAQLGEGIVYAPAEWVSSTGKPIDSLVDGDSVSMEYLRYCHRGVKLHKKMLASGINANDAKGVFPPFSVDRVVLVGEEANWHVWKNHMLSLKQSIKQYYGRCVSAILAQE